MGVMCYRCMKNVPVKDGRCVNCGTLVHSERDPGDDYLLPLGAELDTGNVIVGDKLGRGGFGITYIAYDKQTYGRIALKEFVPSFMIDRMRVNNEILIPESRKEDYEKYKAFFINEATVLSKLNHPNIVKVYFAFNENNTCYYGMDLLSGRNLYEWINANGIMNAEDTMKLMAPVFDALEYVHDRDILHRDISPGNIFLRNSPGSFKDVDPCLIDFGAAYEAQMNYSRSAPHVKSKGFSPPEQNAGHTYIGKYSDVYALSAVLYYMVTGRTPIPAEDRLIKNARLQTPRELNPSVPAKFSDALMKGMALDQQERTQTIRQLREDLIGKPVELANQSTNRTGSAVIDISLFVLCWALTILIEPINELMGGNLLLALALAFSVSLAVNLVVCGLTGGTLGDWIMHYPCSKRKDWIQYAILETLYPYALYESFSGSGNKTDAKPNVAGRSTKVNDTVVRSTSMAKAYLMPTGKNIQNIKISGNLIDLNEEGQTLGRTGEEGVIGVTDVNTVSRRHCKIAFNNIWYIEDQSTNGTFVNGNRLKTKERIPLNDGDIIVMGENIVELQFRIRN